MSTLLNRTTRFNNGWLNCNKSEYTHSYRPIHSDTALKILESTIIFTNITGRNLIKLPYSLSVTQL